jgi:hypothetical protein
MVEVDVDGQEIVSLCSFVSVRTGTWNLLRFDCAGDKYEGDSNKDAKSHIQEL